MEWSAESAGAVVAVNDGRLGVGEWRGGREGGGEEGKQVAWLLKQGGGDGGGGGGSSRSWDECSIDVIV